MSMSKSVSANDNEESALAPLQDEPEVTEGNDGIELDENQNTTMTVVQLFESTSVLDGPSSSKPASPKPWHSQILMKLRIEIRI